MKKIRRSVRNPEKICVIFPLDIQNGDIIQNRQPDTENLWAGIP